jgi:major structural subunit of bundle-forming pilus
MSDIAVGNDTGVITRKLSAKLKRQRGLTLIEAATVLAILAFVVAGIMVLYTNADQSRKTTTTLSQLANVQQGVRSLYGSQATYENLTSAALANSESLPRSMISGTTIRHAFNGSVNVLAADAGGGSSSGFSVEFTNIPKDPCVKMASADLGRGLYSVTAGGQTRSQAGTPPPFDPATAITACSSSSNSITWIFN